MHTLLFGKWKFNVTRWRKCVSLSYCGFFRTAQLGRISTRHCAEEMEFPVLEEEDLSQCCCDLIFFWLTSWVTITAMSNMPFIYHHLLLGMELLLLYLPEQLVSQLTLVHICGRYFFCTSSLSPWRNSCGKVWAWLADECMDFGKNLGCFAPTSVWRTWLVDKCVWMCTKEGLSMKGSCELAFMGIGSESPMCLGDGENELWPLVFWLSGICSSAIDLDTLFSLVSDRLLDRNFLTQGSRLQTSLARVRKIGKMSPVDSLYSVKIAADKCILLPRNTWRNSNTFVKPTRSGWANCQISPTC